MPKRRILNVLLAFFVTVPLLAVITALGFWFLLDAPYGDREMPPVQVTVGRGMIFTDVASLLSDKGLVGSVRYVVWRYRAASRLGLVEPYQAGRYLLSFGQKPSELIAALTAPSEAQRVYTALTIPPGLTSSQIARRVQESGLASSEDVLQAIGDLAVNYPILSRAEGLQGYLFPDTYKLESPLDDGPESSRSTAEMLVSLMADRFFQVLSEIDPAWIKLTAHQLHEKVVLASIVEREYRVSAEAPMIAAVFHNRLNEGIPLQSCATVVYVIEETGAGEPFRDDYWRLNRRIFESYLEIDSPYNTYAQLSLPPAPIAVPGFAALEGAFFPADTSALYFVVKDPAAGTHTFTRHYADHLAARDAYLSQYIVKD